MPDHNHARATADVPEQKNVDDILAMGREELTTLVDEQYKRDFKGKKTDDEVMDIRMTMRGGHAVSEEWARKALEDD